MRRLAPFLAAVLLLAGLILLFRTVQRYDPSAERAQPEGAALGDVSIRLRSATILSRTAGRPAWSLKADRIDMRRGPLDELESYRSVEFAGIRNGVLYRGGRPEAYFSALRAVYDRPAQRFDVQGGLRLRTPRGDLIESDACVWSEHEDFVRLPRGARATFRGQKLSAPAMLFSPRKHLVQCPSGADAVFQRYPLRASQLFWDLDKETVWCPGAVSGERRGVQFDATNVRLNLRTRELTANAGRALIRIEGDETGLEGL